VLIVIAAFVGSIPVNTSQSIAAITTVGDTPDVTSNANQAVTLCDGGQAVTSDTSQGFICTISGGASQLNDVNV